LKANEFLAKAETVHQEGISAFRAKPTCVTCRQARRPKRSVLLLGRYRRHEGPMKEIISALLKAGWGVRHVYEDRQAPLWNIDKLVAEMDPKPVAVTRWEEAGWVFTNRQWREACRWCYENAIVPMQIDFGYWDHYKTIILDAYDKNGENSIKKHWPNLSPVPRWQDADEVALAYRDRQAESWKRAGELGPVPGTEPGYILVYLQGSAYASVLPGPHPNMYDDWVARCQKEITSRGERVVWKYADIHKRIMPEAHVGFGRRVEPGRGIPELNARLLRYAKHSVIVTSSVSNEAVLRGLPVVACGKGWHSGLGVFAEARDWADLVWTPVVDHAARGKWINWWIQRQRPIERFPEQLERVLWETKPTKRTCFTIGCGLGNLIMAMPTIKGLAQHTGGRVHIASMKSMPKGYRDIAVEQDRFVSGASKELPLLEDFDTVTGAAWSAYVPPDIPEEVYSIPPGPDSRLPREPIADAVALRRAGYGGILPSTRLEICAPAPRTLPAAYVVVGMDCTDGKTWSKRRWPHWERFAQLWAGRVPLVFLGKTPAPWAKNYGIDLIGMTEPHRAAAIIQQAEAYVGIDNGLSHLAGATRCPALVLYGPTTSLESGPWFGGLTALAADIPCRSCFGMVQWDTCQHNRCMEQLAPETVVEALEKVLNLRGQPLRDLTAQEQTRARLTRANRTHFGPFQDLEEIRAVWPIIEELRPQRIVEIGTRHGGWCYLMAPICAEGASFVTVDTEQTDAYALMKQQLMLEGYGLTTIVADSQQEETAEAVRCALNGAPADLLHIDGRHRESFVLRDWELYSKMVRPGGVVLFHDADPFRRSSGVYRAILRIQTEKRHTDRVYRWRGVWNAHVVSDRHRMGIYVAEMKP